MATDSLSTSEINFRIQAGRTEDLIVGTICKPGAPRPVGGGYGLIKPPLPEPDHKKNHVFGF